VVLDHTAACARGSLLMCRIVNSSRDGPHCVISIIRPSRREPDLFNRLNQRLEVRGQPRNVPRRSSQRSCEMNRRYGHSS
jgi:hypothetical protein